MTESIIESNWNDSLAAFEEYHHRINKLLTNYRAEIVPLLQKVLFRRRDLPFALRIVEMLSADEKKILLPCLVKLASKTMPHTGTVRNIIEGLPRDWVLERIEPIVEEMEPSDPEQSRRILELYAALDKQLLLKQCQRLIVSDNTELRILAKEFAD